MTVELKRVLIAGCGDVGTELGRRLAGDGILVWGLRRRPDGLPAPIRPISADLCDPGSLRALPDDLDVIVYTAAAGATDEAAYQRTYVDGPRNLLDAIAKGGQSPRRVLFASSTAVYAQSRGESVDELSPTEPRDFRGASVLAGEQIVRSSRTPSVVVRFGGIYGPGRTYLVDSIRAGRSGVSPDGRSPHTNRIHRDDAAGCLAHLLTVDAPAPLYVAVDEEPAPMDDVVRFVAGLLGVEPVVSPGSRSRGGDKRCSSARLRASGYRFSYPSYREGYRQVLERG